MRKKKRKSRTIKKIKKKNLKFKYQRVTKVSKKGHFIITADCIGNGSIIVFFFSLILPLDISFCDFFATPPAPAVAALSVSTLNAQRSNVSPVLTPHITITTFCTSPPNNHEANCDNT